jgi:hypothetical protein
MLDSRIVMTPMLTSKTLRIVIHQVFIVGVLIRFEKAEVVIGGHKTKAVDRSIKQ